MLPQTPQHFFLFAGVEFALNFFQGEVHDVMMMQFLRLDEVAKAQPEPVQKIHFVGGKVWRVRAEDLENFVAGREMNFQIELRLRVAEALPGFADLAGLLFALPLAGGSGDDG